MNLASSEVGPSSRIEQIHPSTPDENTFHCHPNIDHSLIPLLFMKVVCNKLEEHNLQPQQVTTQPKPPPPHTGIAEDIDFTYTAIDADNIDESYKPIDPVFADDVANPLGSDPSGRVTGGGRKLVYQGRFQH